MKRSVNELANIRAALNKAQASLIDVERADTIVNMLALQRDLRRVVKLSDAYMELLFNF